MSELADLYALADILGHDAGCPSLRPEGDYERYDCNPSAEECSVWRTARGILSSANLNELLARAWERGFQTCALRTANELLQLLPRQVDSSNPYRAPVVTKEAEDDA